MRWKQEGKCSDVKRRVVLGEGSVRWKQDGKWSDVIMDDG